MAEKKDTKNKNVVIVEENSDDEKDTGEDCGLSLEKLSLGPKKKLLILCLGGLLFHKVFRYDRHKIPKSRRSDTTFGNFLVYKRPFYKDFLKFCFQRFEVGVWSAAKEANTKNGLDCVMGEFRSKLAFVWDETKCTDSGVMSLEKKDMPLLLKELKKIWENEDSSLPWKKGQYTSANTLMVDDEPYKAILNPPNTAIFVNSYHADNAKDTVLGRKSALRNYLDEVATTGDVPTYVKEHPFGIPAITPSHSDWNHYSKIINKFKKKEE